MSRLAQFPPASASLSGASMASLCGGGNWSTTRMTRASRAGSSAGKRSHTWRAFSNGASSRLRRPGCRSADRGRKFTVVGCRSVRTFGAPTSKADREFGRRSAWFETERLT
jgi:hypothetical protein